MKLQWHLHFLQYRANILKGICTTVHKMVIYCFFSSLAKELQFQYSIWIATQCKRFTYMTKTFGLVGCLSNPCSSYVSRCQSTCNPLLFEINRRGRWVGLISNSSPLITRIFLKPRKRPAPPSFPQSKNQTNWEVRVTKPLHVVTRWDGGGGSKVPLRPQPNSLMKQGWQ